MRSVVKKLFLCFSVRNINIFFQCVLIFKREKHKYIFITRCSDRDINYEMVCNGKRRNNCHFLAAIVLLSTQGVSNTLISADQ